MNSTINYGHHLEELSTSDYVLCNGGTDITGWEVLNESGNNIGIVKDMLFDKENNTIRYLIMELNSQFTNEEKAVIIPIGLANLADGAQHIILPDIHQEQYLAMPRYIMGEVNGQMEEEVRKIIGSPAALRLEEDIVHLDRSNFYNHHHFDKGNMFRQTYARSANNRSQSENSSSANT